MFLDWRSLIAVSKTPLVGYSVMIINCDSRRRLRVRDFAINENIFDAPNSEETRWYYLRDAVLSDLLQSKL